VMSSGTEAGADCSACSSGHVSSDGASYMLDEAVSALPRQMTALSISTVATAGTSDAGDNGLSTPQSSITSDAGLSVSAYQLTSQVIVVAINLLMKLLPLNWVFKKLHTASECQFCMLSITLYYWLAVWLGWQFGLVVTRWPRSM